MPHDWLIVGAGFSGSTMARLLADAGKKVLVIDKRDHIGGNAFDYVNEHGVRIHKYGPHIFHTNCERVVSFLSRFTEWRPYEHRVLSSVSGKLVPFPISLVTLESIYGREFDEGSAQAFLAERVAKDWPEGKEIRTAEDQVVSQIGRELYELFFAGYTRKMWGVDASELDKSVTARIPIRFNRDDRYFTDKHQAMPKDGYTALFERMLDHPKIEVELGLDAPPNGAKSLSRDFGLAIAKVVDGDVKEWGADRIIWTGPIDEFFGHCFGRLPYRSMEFGFNENPLNPAWEMAATTVNYPSVDGKCTRTTNMNRLTATGGPANYTPSVCWEYPTAEGDPYYPIPASQNQALYERYRDLADKQSNVLFLGRLGTYRYMNMDQVVGQALAAFKRLGLESAA